jgi:hypothetical protein
VGSVICKTLGLSGAVIPAEAGIHGKAWKPRAEAVSQNLDSRLRGNDRYPDNLLLIGTVAVADAHRADLSPDVPVLRFPD